MITAGIRYKKAGCPDFISFSATCGFPVRNFRAQIE
jgi:hypothetical protein